MTQPYTISPRRAVNAYAAWFWKGVDSGDAFTQVGRFALFILSIFAVVIVVIVLIAIPIALAHPGPPSLFCATGTQLHPSPTTQMVGKVPVEGVEYTCV